MKLPVWPILALAFCLAGADPEFRGNPQRTGVYPASAHEPVGNAKWKFHTDGRVTSSPAVDGSSVDVGSTDGCMYAIDKDTGTKLWQVRTSAPITSSPAVSGNLVYFGSYNGAFYALEKSSGKVAWKFKTAGERRFIGTHLHGSEPAAEPMPDPFDCFLSSPTVLKGAVYFGSGDGNVYSLNAETGALNWKCKTGDVVHASPAISDGILYVGSWDSYFYAIHTATGKLLWRFKTGEDPDTHNQQGIQSSACVADGSVFFGCCDSKFYALDAKTGEKKWSFDNKGSWVVGSPAVRNGKVFFATSDSSLLYEVDEKTGKAAFSLNFKGWPLFSSPAVAGNRLYVGSNEGKLLAIDLAGQKVAWSFQTEASKAHQGTYVKPDGSPNYEAAFASTFYDDMIVGVNRIYEMGCIQSSPVVVGDTIYVGSADGNLYAVN
ncbi:MAG TPA: PQQ-binding-like beta-propeller repeat protein [Fimbriimonas sp.]|nr:PQQ-binding-like beta-propeller repeat protein [Fimbriimonas sp.]